MRIVFRVSTSWLRSWRQRLCAYRGHGLLLDVDEDRLAVWCEHCGYESPGLELETRAIRYCWMWEKHRLKFQQAQALRRNGRRAG